MPVAPPFRTVSAYRGLAWIREGFGLFRQSPLVWIALSVLWLLVSLLLSLMPLIGSILISLTGPVVLGGLLLGTHAQREDRGLPPQSLWAGFLGGHARPLLLLGVAYLLIGLTLVVATGGWLLTTGAGLPLMGGTTSALQFGIGSAVGLLLILLASALFSLAAWFAPALVVFKALPAAAALKTSLRAGLANVTALAVYGVAATLIVLLASLPLGLGLLVALPVLIASVYCSYRDIFETARWDSLP